MAGSLSRALPLLNRLICTDVPNVSQSVAALQLDDVNTTFCLTIAELIWQAKREHWITVLPRVQQLVEGKESDKICLVHKVAIASLISGQCERVAPFVMDYFVEALLSKHAIPDLGFLPDLPFQPDVIELLFESLAGKLNLFDRKETSHPCVDGLMAVWNTYRLYQQNFPPSPFIPRHLIPLHKVLLILAAWGGETSSLVQLMSHNWLGQYKLDFNKNREARLSFAPAAAKDQWRPRFAFLQELSLVYDLGKKLSRWPPGASIEEVFPGFSKLALDLACDHVADTTPYYAKKVVRFIEKFADTRPFFDIVYESDPLALCRRILHAISLSCREKLSAEGILILSLFATDSTKVDSTLEPKVEPLKDRVWEKLQEELELETRHFIPLIEALFKENFSPEEHDFFFINLDYPLVIRAALNCIPSVQDAIIHAFLRALPQQDSHEAPWIDFFRSMPRNAPSYPLALAARIRYLHGKMPSYGVVKSLLSEADTLLAEEILKRNSCPSGHRDLLDKYAKNIAALTQVITAGQEWKQTYKRGQGPSKLPANKLLKREPEAGQ